MAVLAQYRELNRRVQKQIEEANNKKSLSVITSSSLNAGEDGQKAVEANRPTAEKIMAEHDNLSFEPMDGISNRYDSQGNLYYQVDWDSPSDPLNPRNWSIIGRSIQTTLLIAIAYVVGSTISIDAAVSPQVINAFGVSGMLEAFSSTGALLIGLGVGCLLTSPASELYGRLTIYFCSLAVFSCWTIGSALAPNIAARSIFRFLAGFSCSAPVTVPGGSISDMWNAQEKTWAFPIYGMLAFASTVLGPVIASYIGQSKLGWRWSEWITLLSTGLILATISVASKETFAPQLLLHKAKHFRRLTGDDRYKTAAEVDYTSTTSRLRTTFSRPFLLAVEPIVFLTTFYTTVVYVILFTSLVGYPAVFQKVYKLNQGQSNLCFLGLVIGILLALTTIPFVNKISHWKRTPNELFRQELRLLYAIIGAPFVPVGLLWMAWTDYASIAIWSPLIASIPIGFGAVCIWIGTTMYIIDSYEIYAASALTFVCIVRYAASGVMVAIAVPMYHNLGTHWTLTLLGCLSAIITPIPYLFYVWGRTIRAKSKQMHKDRKSEEIIQTT